jgi:predicted ATPase
VYGEQEYPVHPLRLPNLESGENKERWLAYEAIDLFIQRARATQPEFTIDGVKIPFIARICVHLDGLPLAIELAASQVRIFPLSILANRLEESLDALPSGPRDLPSRQRTLRATLEWSYNLLTENEKILFARLSVFRGGSTLDGVTRICGVGLPDNILETLIALVEKNMVYPRQIAEGEMRFTMLETIHQYAAERLDAIGEGENIRILQADYLADLVETAQKEIYSARQGYWFGRLRDELDNLRSVLNWSLNGNEFKYGLRLVAALHEFWVNDGLAVEGRHWTDLALSSQFKQLKLKPAYQCRIYRANNMPRSKDLLRQPFTFTKQENGMQPGRWYILEELTMKIHKIFSRGSTCVNRL